MTGVRSPGRPRSEAADRAIVAATIRLLAERGYEAMTMDAVAAAAGVSKPTVYRRHASKPALVAAALLEITAGDRPDLPDDTAGALGILLGQAAAALANPGGMTIMGTLLAQERRDPELIAAFRERVFRPRHEVVQTILERGIARGEIATEADPGTVSDLLFGYLLARGVLGEPVDPDRLATIVSTVLRGVRP